jgi:hypothetical protein
MVDTPSSGVKIDGGALRQAALAPGKLAAGISDSVGGLFADVGLKIQANRNARTIFQADLAMRQTKDDFTAQLHKMPDETTWLPAYKAKVTTLRDNLLSGPNVGPDVKRVLTQKLDSWEQATTSEVKTAALLKGIKETREDAITASTYAANQGDIEGAQNTLKAAVANYAMTQEDANKISRRFPSIAAQAQASTAIASNPIAAPEAIKKFESTIEPKVFVSIMARANEAKNRQQAANTNDLAMQMDESPDGTIDPELLKEKVKSGDITQRAADGLLARMKRQNINVSQQDFSAAAMDVRNHDFTNDKKPEDTARQMKDENSHLPEALRLRLYKQIDAQVLAAKKQGEALERPVEKQVLDQMQNDRTEAGAMVPFSEMQGKGTDNPQFSHRIEGGLKALKNPDVYTDEQIKKDFGPSATREKIMEAEKLHAAQMFEQMRAWFRDPANKDATVEQANKQRQTLERPWVMSIVSRAAQKQPRLVRQNGKTYNFDTGEEVK